MKVATVFSAALAMTATLPVLHGAAAQPRALPCRYRIKLRLRPCVNARTSTGIRVRSAVIVTVAGPVYVTPVK